MTLNLYRVQRGDHYAYDESDAYVVAAANEEQARELGSGVIGDQAAAIWYAPTTLVTKVGASDATEPEIVLVSYNAG